MALENPLWGQERIANELWVKLGLHVSPRTVRKYLPKPPMGAQAISVTSAFRLLYVLVVIEHRRRRLIHCNVTAHPTAAWTRQQLRQALGFDTHYGYLLHDRDSIFSRELDAAVGGLGLRILKTPPRCPMANGLCERVIGTIRRECLDWLIPLSEAICDMRCDPGSNITTAAAPT